MANSVRRMGIPVLFEEFDGVVGVSSCDDARFVYLHSWMLDKAFRKLKADVELDYTPNRQKR